MGKCPRGTAEQIRRNLAQTISPISRIEPENEDESISELECIEAEAEDGDIEIAMSVAELDQIRADKRNPPTTEDEIVYLFINHFLDILLISWEGTPCLKPKVTQLPDSRYDEWGISPRTNEKEVKHEKPDNTSPRESNTPIVEEVVSSVNESSKSTTTSESEESEETVLSWKIPPPDEDVYMTFQNGVWYKGRVSRRLMDGEGTFFWEDGASFKGDFIAGTATGFGRMEFPDMGVYEGTVYKGFRHGEGMYCLNSSPVMYSGEWWLGKKNGNGIMYYSNPVHNIDFYKGSWVNGLREGFGCRQYPTGSRYLGEWKNGKKEGNGVMFWCNRDIYRGEWKNGLMDGYGEYIWNSYINKCFSSARANIYRGYWSKGKRNGFGVLELSNGCVIETTWVNDEKHGPGKVVCLNGAVVQSKDELFRNDKPAPLSEKDEKLLRKLFRNHGYYLNGRRTGKPTEQNQLIAYINSVEKARLILIPIHTPVHSLDLGLHTKRLKEQRNRFLQEQKSHMQIFALKNTPRMESFKEKDVDIYVNHVDDEFSTEEKFLRYSIMVNLSKLKDVYSDWATIACETKPPIDCCLLRIFFWELLTVSDVPMRNFSLVDIDDLLADEPSFLVEEEHDPFEKIQFWQFIHFLITISWYLYGRCVYEENSLLEREEVRFFLEEFYNKSEKTILSTAFNYFLQNHIFAEPKTDNIINNWDLLPMEAMYESYKNIGEPHSAKQFLMHLHKRQFPNYRSSFSNSYYIQHPELPSKGKNVILLTSEIHFLEFEESFNHPDREFVVEDNAEIEKIFQDLFAANLTAEEIVHCLLKACPKIVEDDLIVDFEYQMTFLEYYKAITACAAISLQKKAMKQVQSEILLKYKKDLEEYEKKLSLYEKQKELMQNAMKKQLQNKKSRLLLYNKMNK